MFFLTTKDCVSRVFYVVHFVDSELFRPNPDPTYQNVFLIRKQVTGHMLVTLFFEIFFCLPMYRVGSGSESFISGSSKKGLNLIGSATTLVILRSTHRTAWLTCQLRQPTLAQPDSGQSGLRMRILFQLGSL